MPKGTTSTFSLRNIRKKYIAVFGGTLLATTVAIAALIIVVAQLHKTLEKVTNTQEEIKIIGIENSHMTRSAIPWSDQRQRKIMFMRDKIVAEWVKQEYTYPVDLAFTIAETNMIEADKYPSIDPLLLLALECKESSFRDSINSPVGAIGICQIMPTTGRTLMGYLQMEYSISSLYKVETNIRLAAKYLDIIYQDYPKYELILAYYNGGPIGRYYYQTGNPKLAKETANYVATVMDKLKSYKAELAEYRVEALNLDAISKKALEKSVTSSK